MKLSMVSYYDTAYQGNKKQNKTKQNQKKKKKKKKKACKSCDIWLETYTRKFVVTLNKTISWHSGTQSLQQLVTIQPSTPLSSFLQSLPKQCGNRHYLKLNTQRKRNAYQLFQQTLRQHRNFGQARIDSVIDKHQE